MSLDLLSAPLADAPIGKPEPDAAADPYRGDIILADRRYATRPGLAKLLGVTPLTLARWDETRIGPPRIKVGKLVLYDLDKLPDWLERHETQPLERGSDTRRRAAR
jgi:hypothetical protein